MSNFSLGIAPSLTLFLLDCLSQLDASTQDHLKTLHRLFQSDDPIRITRGLVQAFIHGVSKTFTATCPKVVISVDEDIIAPYLPAKILGIRVVTTDDAAKAMMIVILGELRALVPQKDALHAVTLSSIDRAYAVLINIIAMAISRSRLSFTSQVNMMQIDCARQFKMRLSVAQSQGFMSRTKATKRAFKDLDLQGRTTRREQTRKRSRLHVQCILLHCLIDLGLKLSLIKFKPYKNQLPISAIPN